MKKIVTFGISFVLTLLIFLPTVSAASKSESFSMRAIAERGVYSWIRAIDTEFEGNDTSWLNHTLSITGLYDENKNRVSADVKIKLYYRKSVRDSESSSVSKVSKDISIPSSGTYTIDLVNYFDELLLCRPGYHEMMMKHGNIFTTKQYYISGTWTVSGI